MFLGVTVHVMVYGCGVLLSTWCMCVWRLEKVSLSLERVSTRVVVVVVVTQPDRLPTRAQVFSVTLVITEVRAAA